jgi:tripartite-type tricarboxylate transporter receptor subunit TctC
VRLIVRTLAIVASAVALGAPSTGALAQYTDRPINYIIPFVPGGESDIAARLQQKAYQDRFKREMVVSHKPGAGGALAWSQLNALPADGTQIMGINLPHVVLQPLEGNVQYRTDDLVAVYYFHYTPDAILVSVDSPYRTFGDLVKAAREKPGELTFAGSGTNSANHVAHEKFNVLAGVKTTYVPYKGTGDLATAVLGKHVTGALSYVTFAIQQRGKVRALAIATEARHPAFPDVPTFKELGFNWVDGAYRGVAVPKSTPEPLRRQVSDLFAALNQDPALRRQSADGGFELIEVPYDKVPAFMAERTREYRDIAKRIGLLK